MKQLYDRWEDCLSLREIKSLTKLRHPNLVRLVEVIKQKGALYLVFEYCPDGSLVALLERRDKPIPEAAIRNIIWQLL